MDPKDDQWRELIRGTALVVGLAVGELSFEAFVERYGNFYHFNALDGHEDSWLISSSAVLDAAIGLHRAIQEDVFDRLHIGEDPSGQYAASGRIASDEAKRLIVDLAQRHRANVLLRKCRAQRGGRG